MAFITGCLSGAVNAVIGAAVVVQTDVVEIGGGRQNGHNLRLGPLFLHVLVLHDDTVRIAVKIGQGHIAIFLFRHEITVALAVIPIFCIRIIAVFGAVIPHRFRCDVAVVVAFPLEHEGGDDLLPAVLVAVEVARGHAFHLHVGRRVAIGHLRAQGEHSLRIQMRQFSVAGVVIPDIGAAGDEHGLGRGGALIAVALGLQQGRDVFAFIEAGFGEVVGRQSAGLHSLVFALIVLHSRVIFPHAGAVDDGVDQRIVAVHVDVVKVLALVILHAHGNDLREVGAAAAVVLGDHVAHGRGAPDHSVAVISVAVVSGDTRVLHGEAGGLFPGAADFIVNEHLGTQILHAVAAVGIVHADGDHQLVIAVLIRVGCFHLHLGGVFRVGLGHTGGIVGTVEQDLIHACRVHHQFRIILIEFIFVSVFYDSVFPQGRFLGKAGARFVHDDGVRAVAVKIAAGHAQKAVHLVKLTVRQPLQAIAGAFKDDVVC